MAGELSADYDTTVPYVQVAGLLVPAPLVPRIVASFRGVYPAITAGITDDDAAVRAVLKYWVTSTLSTYEGSVAGSGVDEAIDAAREEYRLRAEQARAQAEADAGTITEAPTPVPAEPTP